MMSKRTRRELAMVLAPIMFWLSVSFLAGVAWLIVLYVDVPRVSFAGLEGSVDFEKFQADTLFELPRTPWDQAAQAIAPRIILFLQVIWPLFVLESIATIIASWQQPQPRFWKIYRVLVCFVPPLRLCPTHPDMNMRLWFPGLGWQRRGDRLHKVMEWQCSVPMVIAALLILPVLLIEWTMTKQIAKHDWLRFALHLSTGIIWFAFAAEYIIMMSVTERKFEYFKKHWLDLVIILLPLVSFLRSLRFLRVTRVAKIASLERLSQMMRVYRFRGLSMRVVRAFMVFNVLNRLLHSHPDKQRERLLLQIRGKEMELKELRKRLRELESLAESRRRPEAD